MELKKMLEVIKSKGPKPRMNLDSIVFANKKLDFIQRAMDKNTPSVMIQGQTDPSTHFMESSDGMVYPTVVNHPTEGLRFMGIFKGVDKDGKPMYNTNEAYNYARKTGNFIKFNNDADAQYFAENYKDANAIKIGKPKKK